VNGWVAQLDRAIAF